MKQIILEEPGRFGWRDTAEPEVREGRTMLRVRRIGVCGTDLHAFAGRQPFFEFPRVLGHELGVEVVGLDPADPAGLAVGDRCAVEPYLNCGCCPACRRGKPNCCNHLQVMGVHVDGGMQPLLAVPTVKLHRARSLDFEQLALVETMAIGAHAVERAEATEQDSVAVIGAGPIGLGVIQMLQAEGRRLAVVDISAERLAFCQQHLGVAAVVDAQADIATQLRAANGGDLPSIIIDATGNARSMAGTFDLAEHGGRIVFVGLFPGELSFDDPNFHRRELSVCASRNALPATFDRLIEEMEAGRIDTRPWITHRLPFDQVPEVFPREIAGNPAVRKAVISLD